MSDAVLTELRDAPGDLAQRLQDELLTFAPEVLPVTSEAEELAELIVARGLIPARYRADAVHIAVAVAHEIDMVVSWNFRHIVKWKTRVGVNALITPLGYRSLDVLSPLEVIENAD